MKKKAKLICFMIILMISMRHTTIAQTDSTGYFTSFDGVKIYYEIKGKGKPILLLHGFTGKGADWKKRPVYDSLLANNYQIITADTRGGGKSDKPHTPEAYTHDAEPKDMMGLMKYLGFKQYEAMGYSRGSIILARMLVKDKHLKKAVIGGMGDMFTNPNWARRIGIYEALINDKPTEYDGLRQAVMKNPAAYDRVALAYQQYGQPSTSHEELHKLKQKIMIICGKDDMDNGKGADLQKLIPTSIFTEVSGNHNNTWGSVDYAKEVLIFLKN